jgi:undecaprenyl-diphosphatase
MADVHRAEHEVFDAVRTGGRSVAAVRRFDAAVDAWFEPLRRRPAANRAFYLASEIAEFSLGWHLASACRALAFPRFERSALRTALALGGESLLVNGAVKSAFRRSRPPAPEVAPHRIRRPRTTSFPSGHASGAAMAAVLLSEGSRAWPLWWAAAAGVAASRVHTRMHHASDVVAGAVLGAALALVVRRMWPLDRGRAQARAGSQGVSCAKLASRARTSSSRSVISAADTS